MWLILVTSSDDPKLAHADVMKWKHFPRYWPFGRGIHRSPMNSLHKGQWRGALTFSLICAWINGWVNNIETDDLRRHRTHYDVIVMCCRNHHCGLHTMITLGKSQQQIARGGAHPVSLCVGKTGSLIPPRELDNGPKALPKINEIDIVFNQSHSGMGEQVLCCAVIDSVPSFVPSNYAATFKFILVEDDFVSDNMSSYMWE